MIIKDIKLSALRPYGNNPRDNAAAVPKVAESIGRFGFLVPLVVSPDGEIVCGHTRYEAAKRLGMASVPCVVADGLSQAEMDAFRLVDNRTAELAEWDEAKLRAELDSLIGEGIDLSGFEFGDVLGEESAIGGPGIPEEDPDPSKDPVSRLGDLWEMGGHLLLVGDSTDPASYARLMGGEEADLIVTDPPYNVAVEEGGMTIENDWMGDEEFRAFLGRAFGLSFAKLRRGGGVLRVARDEERRGVLLRHEGFRHRAQGGPDMGEVALLPVQAGLQDAA